MRWPAVLAVGIAAMAGCNTVEVRPFESLPLDADIAADVTQPVHVARDRDGIAHIRAQSFSDAAWVQGYVMAHDRLPQMDVLRHLAAGRLAELYGEPAVDGDVVRRMFRIRTIAFDTWTALQVSSDPVDQELVLLLTRFTNGANAYVHALRRGDWALDPALDFDPATTDDWSPVDSLAIARWWALTQSFTVPFELDATRLYQQLRTFYDGGADASRRGTSRDLWRLAPIGTTPTIAPPFTTGTTAASLGQPGVPPALLVAARDFLGHGDFFQPFGGNAFAIAPGDGAGAVLGSAQDLPLTNPPLFYPTHLDVEPLPTDQDNVLGGDDDAPLAETSLDLIGATIAGVPGVMLGANRDLAWASTASLHDVNDVYLEPADVAVEPVDEDIQIGSRGLITGSIHVRYERTNHGPIIPTIDPATHTLVARSGPSLSFRTTADQPVVELRALVELARAGSIDDGLRAVQEVRAGGQSWMMLDRGGHIAWSADAAIPRRDAVTAGWDPELEQDALSPFFVLPATGAEWIDTAVSLPHAVDPPAGLLVAGNADPIGATFDGKPLDQADGLYLGADYDVGLRQDRIAQLAAGHDAAAIETDTHSSIGEAFTPMLLTALGRLDRQPIPPADLNPYLDALPPADLARLAAARTLLQAWTFATPTDGSDAAATALFHTWLHFFVERSIKDELEAIGFDVWQLDDNAILRVIFALLHDPNSFVTSPASQQPILCDNYAVSGPDDSCSKATLEAMVDAMTYLETRLDPDPKRWQWGALHQVSLAPWPGGPEALRIPSDGSRLPRSGDPATVDRGNPGWADLDFTGHPRGSAYQLAITQLPGAPADASAFALRATLAGGAIFDTRSPHYRDQLDRGYLTGQLLPVASTLDQITAAGETRWVFH